MLPDLRKQDDERRGKKARDHLIISGRGCPGEQALEQGSKSNAMSYLGIDIAGTVSWGVGVHSDIIMSSIYALVCAVNRSKQSFEQNA